MTNYGHFTHYFTNDQPNRSYEPNSSPYFIDKYGALPIKCPFCGYRQDIWKHGANCTKCLGDVLNERIK